MPSCPKTSVVIPCMTLGATSGSTRICRSLWLWVSINPGATTKPDASITKASASSMEGAIFSITSSVGRRPRTCKRPFYNKNPTFTKDSIFFASAMLSITSRKPLYTSNPSYFASRIFINFFESTLQRLEYILIVESWKLWYNPIKESQRAKAAYPPPLEGLTLQSSERRAMLMVTYADLFQFCILLVALVGLCYTVFKGKK